MAEPKSGMPVEMQEMFSKAILRVVMPVVITMLFSIYLTHSVGSGCAVEAPVKDRFIEPSDLIKTRPPGYLVSIPLETIAEEGLTVETLTAIIFLSSFLGCMVIFTFALVLLYKYHCEKVIMVWLFVAVIIIFAWEGGRYLWDWSHGACFSLDYITLGFITWNFAALGLITIFWRAPRVVNQASLITLSALMAYIFRTLPEWSTWVILGLLVLWDIIAVLTPCGPLKMLVELAKERGDALPALVYDTNPEDIGRGSASSAPTKVVIGKKKEEGVEDDGAPDEGTNNATRIKRDENSAATNVYEAVPTTEKPTSAATQASAASRPPVAPLQGAISGHAAPIVQKKKEKQQLGYFGAHLKLGLGDFVFYSVLVSRSSLSGFAATVTSFIAILTGLVLTLFLVTVYKKALPALPISITLGLIFFGATRFAVDPYVSHLAPELLFN